MSGGLTIRRAHALAALFVAAFKIYWIIIESTGQQEGLKVDLEALKEQAEEMSSRAGDAQRAADENKEKARR